MHLRVRKRNNNFKIRLNNSFRTTFQMNTSFLINESVQIILQFYFEENILK